MSVGNQVSLSRNHLESLLKKKTKELIEANTDIAHLQQSCDQLKEDVLLWKTKSDNLAQRCTKLAGLLTKYFAENEIPNQPEKTKTKATSSTEPSLKRNLVNTAKSEVSPLQKKLKEAPSEIDIKEEDKPGSNKTEVEVPKVISPKEPENAESTSTDVPNLPVEATVDYNQPKPTLGVSQTVKGLEVTWDHDTNLSNSQIKQYELFAFNFSLQSRAWKKVGEIKNMKLPIKVTLAQGLKPGSYYYFAVRARSLDDSVGPFSDIQTICLK